MNVIKEVIDDLNAVLKVSVGPDDYKENVSAALRDYAKKANLKGFRKGKVPMSVVKNMFGKSVLFEELNKSLSRKLSDYITEEKLDVLGQPIPRKLDSINLEVDAENVYDFEYEVGLAPNIQLSFKLKEVPFVYEIEIDDNYLDEEIIRIRKRYGEMTNPEVSEAGDILFGKLTLNPEDTGKLPADIAGDKSKEALTSEKLEAMIALNPDRIPSGELKTEMGAGKKAGDVLKGLKLGDIFDKDSDLKRFWEMSPKKDDPKLIVSDADLDVLKKVSFDFEVKRLNRMATALMDEEFFAKVFGADNIKTEEEFRARIIQDLTDFLNGDREKYFRSKAIEALIDSHNLELPEGFLKKWLKESSEELTEAKLETEFPDYLKSLRWSLIAREIRKTNPELEVKEDDLRNHIRTLVVKQYGNMGSEMNDETIDSIVGYTLQDEKAAERYYQELVDERLFGFIREQLNPKSKNIKASEYIKLS